MRATLPRLVLALGTAAGLVSNAKAIAVDASDGRAQAAAAPTCIALVVPSVLGVEGSATDVGLGLRELFASYLTGPSLRTIQLEARLLSQALEEARAKDCNHVLSGTLTRKRRGGSSVGKALGQAAGTAAWVLPYGGTVGSAAARGAVIAGAQAASSLASSTRAKDEMQLDYKVSSLDGRAAEQPRTEKAKARTDGEDLLTPMVERAAEAVAGSVLRR
jgi:hypothetical protein